MGPKRDDDYLFPELHSLLDRLPSGRAKRIPIVLVPGFVGWGSPLLNSFNYFGGFQDIAGTLVNRGWTVIIPQLGPFSSNWERACELYAQLTHGSYDPDGTWDVQVDYGTEFQAFLPNGLPAVATGRRQAFSLTYGTDGPAPRRLKNWKWSEDSPVHFVTHSQGGNTVRYLIHLLRNGKADHQYFAERKEKGWVESLVTLATPHNGTTIIDVLKNIDPTGIGHLLINQTIVTASFQPQQTRIYDPQLDHWGICPLPDEDFLTMSLRLTSPGGPLQQWFQNNHNGFYDNSIAGVAALNAIVGPPAENVYYFTFSCGATLSTIPKGVLGRLTNKVLGFIPQGVIKPPHHALQLGSPGSQLPRADMFPAFSIFGYVMGGYQLTIEQKSILACRSVDMQQNDGIVNTASMQGPRGSVIEDVDATVVTLNRGRFYHMGTNDAMDHADAIGIVVDTELISRVKTMYLGIAELLSRLPTDS
ncbi:Alpha/Beta hydrolase protein [Trichophaea hybrida]|nr:Alpha/Beta hydrolase protein [Trichophaea hybrida]